MSSLLLYNIESVEPGDFIFLEEIKIAKIIKKEKDSEGRIVLVLEMLKTFLNEESLEKGAIVKLFFDEKEKRFKKKIEKRINNFIVEEEFDDSIVFNFLYSIYCKI